MVDLKIMVRTYNKKLESKKSGNSKKYNMAAKKLNP